MLSCSSVLQNGINTWRTSSISGVGGTSYNSLEVTVTYSLSLIMTCWLISPHSCTDCPVFFMYNSQHNIYTVYFTTVRDTSREKRVDPPSLKKQRRSMTSQTRHCKIRSFSWRILYGENSSRRFIYECMRKDRDEKFSIVLHCTSWKYIILSPLFSCFKYWLKWHLISRWSIDQ